jgi:hypothetical protein
MHREKPMLKDYVWHFYDDVEEICLEEYDLKGDARYDIQTQG